ncbi:MAG: hypothetical protein A2571_03480 [Candidatus Vogelbacteria bacterium RIFOXYD1_FULL_44_32]|uniref:Uncharacterized protein n=1 Tax=Candidatus Vogelbacteria bacterium RIFOXYD1_FULL_44_32 TaxID=1802438 RepID=A0A1G2QG90_9BACT|nr:MAG: hypothetical protein A2571_03480 [Candidatus Vogelbacteria bacterium RIFOXYD1_FULL_44_32]
MSWRRRRQFSLIMTVVLFFALVGGVFYYFKKPNPSCFDNKKNQTELGVDCGGTCAKVCQTETVALAVLWTRVFEITPGNYSALAYVENANRQFGLPNFTYEFILTDAEGGEITRATGQTFANPKERFMVFSANISAPAGKVARAFVEFPASLVWQRLTKSELKLEVKRKDWQMAPTPNLTAEVLNGEVRDLRQIPVYVVLSDKNGNAISASATFIDEIKGLTATNIYFTWPLPLVENPTFFDFYAHPNLFELSDL